MSSVFKESKIPIGYLKLEALTQHQRELLYLSIYATQVATLS